MRNWFNDAMIEDGLLDSVWQESLDRFDGLMKSAQTKLGDFAIGACSLVLGRSMHRQGGIAAPESTESVMQDHAAVTADDAPEMLITPRLQQMLEIAGLDFGGISDFGEAIGCAAPAMSFVAVRAPAAAPSPMLYRKPRYA